MESSTTSNNDTRTVVGKELTSSQPDPPPVLKHCVNSPQAHHAIQKSDSFVLRNEHKIKKMSLEDSDTDSEEYNSAELTPAMKKLETMQTHYKCINDCVKIDTIELLEVPHLQQLLPNCTSNEQNIRHTVSKTLGQAVEYENLMGHDNVILADIVRKGCESHLSRAYVRAGPRKTNYFHASDVIAGIVTCGGLCPGLNNVIRNIVTSLHNLYGVQKVLGFIGGYGGIYSRDPVELTLQSVSDIHLRGGTILSSSRGGFDEEKIANRLESLGINQLYCIGGDGTMRGAHKLALVCAKRACSANNDRPISVSGIPKTIDNDIDLLDRSFGFYTAVEEAVRAIRSARTEASCVPNGVGVVKLMGRHAGFIAAHAALSSGDCDLCLIPEVPMILEGPFNCLDHIVRVVKRQGFAVVVVAEGAGEDVLGKSEELDQSGNRKLPAIGYWLKKQIEAHFQALQPTPMEATVKYIDPSYMIRSVAANSADSIFCLLLAQNAVHGTMAGYTGFCTALCNDRVVYLPISAIVENSPRTLNPYGRTWERVLSVTGQPDYNRKQRSTMLITNTLSMDSNSSSGSSSPGLPPPESLISKNKGA